MNEVKLNLPLCMDHIHRPRLEGGRGHLRQKTTCSAMAMAVSGPRVAEYRLVFLPYTVLMVVKQILVL